MIRRIGKKVNPPCVHFVTIRKWPITVNQVIIGLQCVQIVTIFIVPIVLHCQVLSVLFPQETRGIRGEVNVRRTIFHL